mgnify:FL=1
MQPVLALRRHKEETLRRKLADSERVLGAEMENLRRIDLEIKAQLDGIAERRGPGPLDLDGLSLGSEYLTTLERRLDDQAERVGRLSKEVEENRVAVLQASREKKSLERLRRIRLEDFTRETNRSEQKVAEETASTRHLLRQRQQVEV